MWPPFKNIYILALLLPTLAYSASNLAELERLPREEPGCSNIKRIHLIGDSAHKLKWAITAANYAPDGTKDVAIGRCLGARGMNVVMNRIQNAILDHGFMTTRVLAGPQSKLNKGILELTVFPGRIHQIHFSPSLGFKEASWSALPAKEGRLLNMRDLDQTLENFKRLPTLDADIQLIPAEGSGVDPAQSDLLIKWKKHFPLRLNLSLDDSGTKTTGKYQGSGTLFYDGWNMYNQLFYINFNRYFSMKDMSGHSTQGFGLHYSIVKGYWIWGLTTNSSQYRQSVPGMSQTYIYSGNNDNLDLKASRVIYRDIIRKTTLSLTAWVRKSKNFIDGTEVEVQNRRMGGWDFGASHREFIYAATMDLNLNYRFVTSAFSKGREHPQMIMADLQLNLPFQVVKYSLRYNNTWRGRWNQTPLVPLDRFSIGGRYTIRGFNGENQLLAEHGWLVRNDLGLLLGKTTQELYTGIDYGIVGGSGSQTLIGHALSGGVIGLRCDLKKFSYDLFLGKPFYKPNGFETSRYTAGFNLNASF